MNLTGKARPSNAVLPLLSGAHPPALRSIFLRFLTGEISPAMTLMRLLIETCDLETASKMLDTLSAQANTLPDLAPECRQSLGHLAGLLRENYQGCTCAVEILRADVGAPARSVDEGIALCKRLFDWSVQQCAEASVALYSFGNPQILENATAEVVDKMQTWGLLGPDRTALEIGCGIGRFQAALASRLKEITGIDVSAKMIETARMRCADLTNAHLLECCGHDLAQFPGSAFDLVFAVDSFPYLYQSGMPLVETHFHEAARVLKPRGDFLILNFSYRDDIAADRKDVAYLTADAGFETILNGAKVFSLWDGTAFHLRLRY